MSQYAKQYREFFNETDAGKAFTATLADLVISEQVKAADATDMEEAYAHIQRAKGVQMAIGKVNTLTMEAKKPM